MRDIDMETGLEVAPATTTAPRRTAQVIPLSSALRREMRAQLVGAGRRPRVGRQGLDALTGLPGRERFAELLEHTVAAQPAHASIALLVVRIERFADVNAVVGQEAGDSLIGAFADRLRECLGTRAVIADDAAGTSMVAAAARLRGIRFGVLLARAGEAELQRVRQAITDQLQRPFEVDGQSIFLTVTMGAASYPRDAADAGALLRSAERALESARQQGLAYALGGEAGERHCARSLALQSALHRALADGELRLAYQPIVEAGSGRVVAAEALLRWDDPVEGAVSPAEFVPVAEQCGLMVQIGEFVLREAIGQLRAWSAAGLRPVRVAVNLSLRQLVDGDVAALVDRELSAGDVDPALLELELSERGVINAHAEVLEQIHRLKALGVRISIDDFGTGQSAIAYLKDVPADVIKIDRSYVSGPGRSARGDAICAGMVALARQLGAEVVGEGVESKEQLERLRGMGCDFVQGFLFSPAVRPAELAAGLRWA